MRALHAIVAGIGVALTLAPSAFAQEPAQPGPAAAPAQVERIETAPVVIDGEVLFRLRGTTSFPAKQRADGVAERIKIIAHDESIGISELRTVDAQDRSSIFAGELHIVSIVDLDAESEQMHSRHLLAEIHKTRIGQAIGRYRHERSAAYLQAQGMRAAIALGVLAALLLGMRWLFRRTGNAVTAYFQANLKELEARSFRLLSVEELKSAWLGGLRAVHFLIGFALALAAVNYALSLFPWTRPAAHEIVALVIDPLKAMGTGIIGAVPGLVFIVILVVITRYGLRLLRLFFSGVAQGTIQPAGFDRDWAWPTYRLLRLGVIAFALVIAYPYIPGSSSEAFKGISLFLGLLMSLGAASMVANSLAGYALIYRRVYKVGDRIKVGDVVGDVVDIRQQVTHLQTPKNEIITIPSSTILGTDVVNYSALARDKGLILHTTVGIGYETPWRQVEAMLIEAANRTEGLLREPAPFVNQKSLGDFCVTYEINAYTDQPQRMNALYSELHRSILDVFNEYGVQIMTPAYEGDPEKPKVVEKKDWFLAPAAPTSAGKRDE
jgi:small-conductance mechanosensitive channel